jgi:hypothetical protein
MRPHNQSTSVLCCTAAAPYRAVKRKAPALVGPIGFLHLLLDPHYTYYACNSPPRLGRCSAVCCGLLSCDIYLFVCLFVCLFVSLVRLFMRIAGLSALLLRCSSLQHPNFVRLHCFPTPVSAHPFACHHCHQSPQPPPFGPPLSVSTLPFSSTIGPLPFHPSTTPKENSYDHNQTNPAPRKAQEAPAAIVFSLHWLPPRFFSCPSSIFSPPCCSDVRPPLHSCTLASVLPQIPLYPSPAPRLPSRVPPQTACTAALPSCEAPIGLFAVFRWRCRLRRVSSAARRPSAHRLLRLSARVPAFERVCGRRRCLERHVCGTSCTGPGTCSNLAAENNDELECVTFFSSKCNLLLYRPCHSLSQQQPADPSAQSLALCRLPPQCRRRLGLQGRRADERIRQVWAVGGPWWPLEAVCLVCGGGAGGCDWGLDLVHSGRVGQLYSRAARSAVLTNAGGAPLRKTPCPPGPRPRPSGRRPCRAFCKSQLGGRRGWVQRTGERRLVDRYTRKQHHHHLPRPPANTTTSPNRPQAITTFTTAHLNCSATGPPSASRVM